MISRRAFLLLVLPLLIAVAARADTPTLDPEQLIPGEAGYGLSVFAGTTVEKFEISIIGVLKNAMAGQDMILIRCAGHGLEHAKVVAGMSGSPIYVRGKLIGALAYGWSFAADPIAGVTPIRNMLGELKVAAAPRAAPPVGLTRLANPLLVSGVPEAVLARHEARLTALGWLPVAGAGTSGATALAAGAAFPSAPVVASVATERPSAVSAAPTYEPGSAIAVHLVRGDVSMAAIGTVTWRDGTRVLAFGHPFQGTGQVSLAAGPARIVTVLPRLSTSFKMGDPVGEEGSMIWDGLSGITVATDRLATMVPVTVAMHDARRGIDRKYQAEVASNPLLTPMLVQMVLGSVLETCGGSSDDVTSHIQVRARFKDGRSITLEDDYYTGRDALASGEPFGRALSPLETLVARVELAGLDATMRFEPGRRTAQLKRALCDTARLTPGRDGQLTVWFKPYGQPEERRTVSFHVPEDAAGTSLDIMLQPGDQAPPLVAAPETVDDAIAAVTRRHHTTDLVATLTVPGRRLNFRGHVLRRLPRSVLPILESPNGSPSESAPEILRVVSPTPWVVQGALRLKVPVKEVAFE